jgi:hypothetical protein
LNASGTRTIRPFYIDPNGGRRQQTQQEITRIRF